MKRNENNDYATPFEEFGFEVHDGWLPIVKKLVEELKEADPRVEIEQIKTKFGELRCYTSYYTDEIEKIINKYEDICANTCEYCGSNENVTTFATKSRWIVTLCDKCKQKVKRER